MVFLYVIKGNKGKRYVGITNNLARRLQEHRSRSTQAGKLLGDISLLYTEKFEDYRTAREQEKFLKSGKGRQWLDEFESKSRPA